MSEHRHARTASCDQLGCRAGTAAADIGYCPRDRAAGLLGYLYAEPLRQHRAMRGARIGHRAHPLWHRNRADLCADCRRIRDECGLYPRGLGWAVSLWYRCRARTDASAAQDHGRQALGRHARLCRQDQIVRGHRRHAADRARGIAQADGGARCRDRTRGAVRQCQPVASRGVAVRHPSGEAHKSRFSDRQYAAGLHHRR
jgi:hypothetical protein